MPEFFHVDRPGNLSQGMVLNMPITNETHPGLYLPPDGMSYFGYQNWLLLGTKPNDVTVEREGLLETIRKRSFGNRPSRFSALFGTETIADAKKFRSEWGKPEDVVWVVRCDRYFKADMNWFDEMENAKGDIRLKALAAAHYWKQTPTANPYWEWLLVAPIQVLRMAE